ncbi:MAG TPA: DUF5715 family protein [Blastocatellia bacterium]|nr:DUF5715 family protein [Blastocatellia bacterium]
MLVALCLLTALCVVGCRKSHQSLQPPPPTVEAPMVDPWKAAAHKVEEDRGEPTGRKATINTPAELQHYSDRRRFLAVQVAETREQHYNLPQDYADLARLIRKGELVEMPPLGDDYILYGVGGNASDDPFLHYDPASGQNIPLFSSDDEFKREDTRLNDSLKEPQARLADLEHQLQRTGKRDRARRQALSNQIAEARRAVDEITSRKKLLESFYLNRDHRRELTDDYQTLTQLAADFGGKTYNLEDPASRRAFKVRLLSFLRPPAREVLLEIAHEYKTTFARPLPITSMVRPEQYQRRLGEKNPNATKISTPPHATGLAFDVYNYFMTATEQEYLMAVIARMKDAGRVEALRENRDHIHVFAFADGARPDEKLIASSLGEAGAKPAANAKAKKATKPARVARGGSKRHAAARAHKGRH